MRWLCIRVGQRNRTLPHLLQKKKKRRRRKKKKRKMIYDELVLFKLLLN